MQRELDIVVFGATGYTGRLVAAYLAGNRELRLGLAGRNRAKLEEIRGGLGVPDLPILVADAHDRAALDQVASRARVVCTTVGPYAKYGSDLVAACVAAGTHYCDITGEVQWMRRMIDAHDEAARASGARIVHTCGFDSIPSDLGVWMLHQEAAARGQRLLKVEAFFGESKGAFGGGTIASMFNIMDEARRDRDVRRVLADPYSLAPGGERGPDGSDLGGFGYERRLGRWTAPFMMAAVNARVVRRSNALAGYAYGKDFSYREVMSLGGGARGLAMATAVTAGMAGFAAGAQIGPVRRVLEKRLPAPGEGPSREQRERGFWTLRMIGTTDRGELRAKIGDRRDPGFDSTATMLAESALCLARDELTSPGGILTPSVALDGALLARLRAAGLTFEIAEIN